MQRIAAGVAAVLLLLALIGWVLSDPQVANPGIPRFTGGALSRLEATQPKIAAFEYFYQNDDNPFVPFSQREKERTARVPRGVARVPVAPVPTTVATLPPRPPVKVIAPPPRAALALPKLTAAGPTAPICVGLVNVDGKEVLMARMPGTEGAAPMAVGDEASGWKLIAIDNGNQARFTDATGAEHVYPIGEGDLAMVPASASAAESAPPSPLVKPGILPKLPVGPRPLPAGGMLPPPKPGAMGATPKPGQVPEQPPRRKRLPVQPVP